MATPSDVIHRALRLLGVIAVEETPSSAEVNTSLAALNQMLASWDLDGIKLGHETLALTDTINQPDDHIRGFAYNLAVDLAPEYGVEPSRAVAAVAGQTKEAIRRAYTKPNTLRVPHGLQQAFRHNWGWR